MVPSPAKERNVTVFLSDLKVSEEQSIPVAIETNRRHFRGTVTTISEEGAASGRTRQRFRKRV
jgi:hypothetical protein